MKKYLKILVIAVCLLILPGCWSYQELDRTAFIMALGIDKGEENLLTLTAQIAVPKNIAGGGEGSGGGGGKKSTMIVSVETRTILGGLNMLGSFVERRPSLKHTKAIVFSSKLAREDMGRYLAPLVRYPEFRRNTFIFVSKSKAKDVIKATQPILENSPSKYIELLGESRENSGFFPKSQVHYFYNAAKSSKEQPAAILAGLEKSGEEKKSNSSSRRSGGSFTAGEIPRQGGNKLEYMGAAVFRGGKMVGTINGNEAAILNMVKGQYDEGIYSLPDPGVPGKYILLETLAERSPQINVKLEGNTPVVDVNIPLEASFISIQSNINYEKPEKISEVEKAFEDMLKSQAEGLVRKTQEEYHADIFGFGNQACKEFSTWQEWENYGWLAAYSRADVNISFDIDIRRIGLLRQSSPVRGE